MWGEGPKEGMRERRKDLEGQREGGLRGSEYNFGRDRECMGTVCPNGSGLPKMV